jgi:uncharacterized membrane protein
LYWFQWRYRVHWFVLVLVAAQGSLVVLVSVAVKVSLVCACLSGGNIFVKQNTTFITKRLENFGC